MEQDLPGRLTAVRFRWRARFGFFLRAEAAAAGFGYPTPPRTAVLGVIANVLGLPKDALATELEGARVSVSGAVPPTHWHNGNHRKVPPAALPAVVKTGGPDGASAPEKNTQLRQEWLLRPSYVVTAALPAEHHSRLLAHLSEGTSHFSPCMGLSEMSATVEFVDACELVRLPAGDHPIASVVRVGEGTEILAREALAAGLHVLALSMPRTVTADRRFGHAHFLVERHGKAVPCRTDRAYGSPDGAVVFL